MYEYKFDRNLVSSGSAPLVESRTVPTQRDIRGFEEQDAGPVGTVTFIELCNLSSSPGLLHSLLWPITP